MLAREIELLRSVEDEHWWYRCLRRLAGAELQARLPARARVLDVGCGTGGMLAALRERAPGWELAGIDRDPAAVRHCAERRLTGVVQGDAAALPFASESFDAVVCLDVLYHAEVDEGAALAEIGRVLVPGAILVLNVPAFECLRGSHDEAVCGARRYVACHVRDLLQAHKLDAMMIHYWNAWLFVPTLVWRQWSRRTAPKRPNGVTSDVWLPRKRVNDALSLAAGVDARLCRALRLPFGSSIFAVAQKSPATNES